MSVYNNDGGQRTPSQLSLDRVAGEEQRQLPLERYGDHLRFVVAAAQLVLAEDDCARVRRRRIVRVVRLEKARIEDDVRDQVECRPFVGVCADNLGWVQTTDHNEPIVALTGQSVVLVPVADQQQAHGQPEQHEGAHHHADRIEPHVRVKVLGVAHQNAQQLDCEHQ